MIIKPIKDLKIKYKFLFILISVTAISLIAVILMDYFIMKNRYSELQLIDAESNQKRILNAIENELIHLDGICHGWASWDDTYEFMQTHDTSFIQKNLTYRSYNVNEFNMVCLLDTNYRIFVDEGYCTVSRKKLVPVIFTDSRLLKESGFIEFLRNDSPDMKKYGIMITDYGLMMITMRPILTTEDKGPSRGFLIMGKNLDPVRIKTLIKQTELDFSIIKIGDKYAGNDASLINEIINKNESSIIIQDGNKIRSYFIGTDIYGKKAYIIRALLDNSIMKEGYRTILLNVIVMVFAILLFIAISWLIFNKYIINPVNALASQVQSITMEEYKKGEVLTNKDELGMLSSVIDEMAGTITERNNQLKSANAQLERLSITDGLTGIFNRRYFDEMIKSEWDRGIRKGETLSLVICDIDLFKKYNDMYGHQAGDECLAEIANVINRKLQREGDKVFRYGGEEFIAILPVTSLEGAVHMATLFLNAVSKLDRENKYSPEYGIITISAGVSSLVPDKNTSYNYLIELADSALYQSKNNGRNRINSAEVKENGEVIFTEYVKQA